MPSLAPSTIARELTDAYENGQYIESPSTRNDTFDLSAAYAVEAELVRLRRASGRATVGRKVGYANKALWRVLKLNTLVWAHMYDDTVHYAEHGHASLTLTSRFAPKIEPEIVFKLNAPLGENLEPAQILAAVEWLALGFEIIDCPYADWKYQPADFVAAFGFHRALVVGTPQPVNISTLVDQLPRFTVKLFRNGELVEEGSGRNSLRSPALCLGELATSIARQPGAEPLAAGELVSSGTLTDSQPFASGEVWKAAVDGLNLLDLTLHT